MTSEKRFCYLCGCYQPEGHTMHSASAPWNTCKHCGQRIYYSGPDTYFFHVLGPDKLGPLDCAGGHALPQGDRPKHAPVASDFDCCDEEATVTVKSFTTGTSATRLISSLTDKMPQIKLRDWLQQQWDLGNRRFCANCTHFKPECGPEAEVPFDHGDCTFDLAQLVMPTAVRIESCYTDATEGADCPFHEPLPDGIPQDAPFLETMNIAEWMVKLPELKLFKALPSGEDRADREKAKP